MANPKKKTKPEDETLEAAALETPEGESSEATEDASEPDNQPEDETGVPVEVTVNVDATEAIKAVHAFTQGDLQHRVTKAARAIVTHGGQEKVHALNQLELLTGRMKMALPAGIVAVEDKDLKAGLELLLGLL